MHKIRWKAYLTTNICWQGRSPQRIGCSLSSHQYQPQSGEHRRCFCPFYSHLDMMSWIEPTSPYWMYLFFPIRFDSDLQISYSLQVEFEWDFRRLIWLVARLNLNGRCSGRCYVNSTTFHCISQLFLVKCMTFCSENKITLNGYVTLTCDNQFFIKFELNW